MFPWIIQGVDVESFTTTTASHRGYHCKKKEGKKIINEQIE